MAMFPLRPVEEYSSAPSPRLSPGDAVAVTTLLGEGSLPFNNTSYVGLIDEDLFLVCAGENAEGDTNGVRVLTLDPEDLTRKAREAWVPTGGRAAAPTIVKGLDRSVAFGAERALAFLACAVDDTPRRQIQLFVLRQLGLRRRQWESVGVVSGAHDKCETPSLSFDPTTKRVLIAFTASTRITPGEPDVLEVRVVELDHEGTVLRGPTPVGVGDFPSICAQDGWVVVSWRRLQPGAKTDAGKEVAGLYWSSDDWPPGDETVFGWIPRVLAGPTGLDPAGQAKDPCVASAGGNGRFWVSYDKRRGTALDERDIGVVELYAGDGIDWFFEGVALQATATDGMTACNSADFAFGRGGLVGGMRLAVWEAKKTATDVVHLASAIGTASGTRWRDDLVVLAGDGRDMAFPSYVADDRRVFLVWMSGEPATTAPLVVRGCTLRWDSDYPPASVS